MIHHPQHEKIRAIAREHGWNIEGTEWDNTYAILCAVWDAGAKTAAHLPAKKLEHIRSKVELAINDAIGDVEEIA